MKKLFLLLAACLGACGGGGRGDDNAAPVADAFMAEVQRVVASGGDGQEPGAVGGVAATRPDGGAALTL